MAIIETLKVLFLAATLAFLGGSYFCSDVFNEGLSFTGWLQAKNYVERLCGAEMDPRCAAAVERGVLFVNVRCLTEIRWLWLCQEKARLAAELLGEGGAKGGGDCNAASAAVQQCSDARLAESLQAKGWSAKKLQPLMSGIVVANKGKKGGGRKGKDANGTGGPAEAWETAANDGT